MPSLPFLKRIKEVSSGRNARRVFQSVNRRNTIDPFEFLISTTTFNSSSVTTLTRTGVGADDGIEIYAVGAGGCDAGGPAPGGNGGGQGGWVVARFTGIPLSTPITIVAGSAGSNQAVNPNGGTPGGGSAGQPGVTYGAGGGGGLVGVFIGPQTQGNALVISGSGGGSYYGPSPVKGGNGGSDNGGPGGVSGTGTAGSGGSQVAGGAAGSPQPGSGAGAASPGSALTGGAGSTGIYGGGAGGAGYFGGGGGGGSATTSGVNSASGGGGSSYINTGSQYYVNWTEEQNLRGMGYPGIGAQGGSNLPTDGKNNAVFLANNGGTNYGTMGQPGFVIVRQFTSS